MKDNGLPLPDSMAMASPKQKIQNDDDTMTKPLENGNKFKDKKPHQSQKLQRYP